MLPKRVGLIPNLVVYVFLLSGPTPAFYMSQVMGFSARQFWFTCLRARALLDHQSAPYQDTRLPSGGAPDWSGRREIVRTWCGLILPGGDVLGTVFGRFGPLTPPSGCPRGGVL